MIPAIPEVSVFRIALDQAGESQFIQTIGYFHLWRFENSDGTVSLDGELGVVFGGNGTRDDQMPMSYNSRVQYDRPVDRCTLRWNAQPGRVAVILVGPRGSQMEANNTPARQLVFQGQATAMQTAAVAVLAAATQVAAANTRRSRVLIVAPASNIATIFVGPQGVTIANGIPLDPGQSYVGFSSARYDAIAAAVGNNVRVMEELS